MTRSAQVITSCRCFLAPKHWRIARCPFQTIGHFEITRSRPNEHRTSGCAHDRTSLIGRDDHTCHVRVAKRCINLVEASRKVDCERRLVWETIFRPLVCVFRVRSEYRAILSLGQQQLNRDAHSGRKPGLKSGLHVCLPLLTHLFASSEKIVSN